MPPRGDRLDAIEHAELHGHLKLTVRNECGRVVDEREGDNVICTTGFTAIAAALVWSGLQDQATNLGITTSTYLTPLYGALGSGAGTPVKSDTQLFSELGRTTVSGGGSTPATSTIAGLSSWLFFFSNPPTNWTVTEAGIFAGATSTANSGSMVDHWSFSPSVSVLTTNTTILQVSLEFGP